jgi:hypothetical protein
LSIWRTTVVLGLGSLVSNVHATNWVARVRLVSILTALALCLGLVSAVISPSAAAAQADELTQREFDRLLDAAAENEPVYGPEEGELILDQQKVAASFSDVTLADFVASVTFQNPFAGTRQQFDYGIQFRITEDEYLRFILLSDGTWAIVEGDDEILASDVYEDIDAGRRGENTLTVYAEADLVHAAINGDYVGSVEVSNDNEGEIAIASGYMEDSFQDGAVTGFAEFTVWEIGGSGAGTTDDDSSGRLGPKTPGSRNDESSDKDDETGNKKDNGGKKKVDGTTYESPKYGYTLTYDDSWELGSENSAETIDSLTLEDEVSKLEILGLPANQAPAECVDALVEFHGSTMEEGGIDATYETFGEGAIEDGNREGAEYVEVLVTAETTEGSVVFLLYVECGPVDGSDYQVAVQHTIYTDDITGAYARRDAVVSTLAQAGAEPTDDPEPTKTPKKDDDKAGKDDDKPADNTADTGTNITDGDDGRLVYVSPSYGFTVEILPDWTVEQNTVEGGYDTLVVADDKGRVTVSGFASTGTAVNCINSILTNLNADPNLSNVGVGVQPDGSDSRWDSDTTSEVVVFFTANGVNYARYYACFSGNDGQSILVFAYEALEGDISTEFENIEQMLDLIRVP